MVWTEPSCEVAAEKESFVLTCVPTDSDILEYRKYKKITTLFCHNLVLPVTKGWRLGCNYTKLLIDK